MSQGRLWSGNSNGRECRTEPREVQPLFSATRPPGLRESLNTLAYGYFTSDTARRFPMKSVKTQ